MNQQVSVGVTPPAPPRSLKDTGLSIVMMRDILLKTVFRKNLETVSDISEAIALSLPLTQQLVEIAREQRLMEAQGTLHAGSGNEMAFQLSDSGKARALDALSQSEYYGALPVPLDKYKLQVENQSVRNIHITRERLDQSMGHLILPDDLLDNLGRLSARDDPFCSMAHPATVSLPSRTGSGTRSATQSMSRIVSNMRVRL